MNEITFTKMHGAGNDYIYLDAVTESQIAQLDLPALSRAISDRHKGVGSDGLIVLLPPRDDSHADIVMRMFNADGSESEMCGNGIRCVAKMAHDRGLTNARPIRIRTGAGVLSIDYTINGDGRVETATVDMGRPILDAILIPMNLPEQEPVIDRDCAGLLDLTLETEPHWIIRSGLDPRMTAVSMGNPHVVFFCQDVAAVPLERIGPRIETHELFPRRVNVHFVQVVSRGEVSMRTWERGSGITQACGTGACAVCVAGALSGRTDRAILAHLPGGDLQLRWDSETGHVFMTGEAVEVFTGTWTLTSVD